MAQWVFYGQDPQYFWECTHRELKVILNASTRGADRRAWQAAAYNISAYHKPGDFPEMPTLELGKTKSKKLPSKETTDGIAARQIMRAWANRSA